MADQPLFANEARGEAVVTIGTVTLTIAVTFAGLARLSRMTDVDSMDTLYRRLIGFHPWTVICALRAFAMPDGPTGAPARTDAAIAVLSAADERAWKRAIETALAGHIDQGRKSRGEPTMAEQALAADPDSAPGEADRPSA